MDTHTFFLIMRNEMKLQMRSWVFRFFIVLSLVGIVAYQMYIHGAGSSAWKMVALPCSMPLMNAYLFSVVQSLFLIVIMSEFPQRLIRSGLRDGVMVRPFSNTVYYWGALTGIFLLFLLVNVVEVFVVILLVNSVNAAPLSLSLYFFYILTLNVPCFFFVSGLAALLGSRPLFTLLQFFHFKDAVNIGKYRLYFCIAFLKIVVCFIPCILCAHQKFFFCPEIFHRREFFV